MKIQSIDACMERFFSESHVDSIQIDKNVCQEYMLPFITWNGYSWLKHIVIGSDNFGNVSTFEIIGQNTIRSLKIGDNSFTKHKKSYGKDDSKTFEISNCEKLESIEIGQYSFSDYSGKFELRNIPFLKSLKIGIINKESINCYYGAFSLKGINITII